MVAAVLKLRSHPREFNFSSSGSARASLSFNSLRLVCGQGVSILPVAFIRVLYRLIAYTLGRASMRVGETAGSESGVCNVALSLPLTNRGTPLGDTNSTRSWDFFLTLTAVRDGGINVDLRKIARMLSCRSLRRIRRALVWYLFFFFFHVPTCKNQGRPNKAVKVLLSNYGREKAYYWKVFEAQ